MELRSPVASPAEARHLTKVYGRRVLPFCLAAEIFTWPFEYAGQTSPAPLSCVR